MTIYINKDETVFHLEMKDSSYIFRILENDKNIPSILWEILLYENQRINVLL